MNQKIVIVGPPAAGKTTLRKIFFEGENSLKLLKYGLEPTRGQESIILNLQEKIGIFDLGGQENKRWLESEEKSVFHNAKVLIIVIDITNNIDSITDFLIKILKLKKEMTFTSSIYALFHKVDLVSTEKISELISILNTKFPHERRIKFLFTSVKKDYIAKTFSYFIEILNDCLSEENALIKSRFRSLEVLLKILYNIYEKEFIHLGELYDNLNYPRLQIKEVLEHLITEKRIQKVGLGNNITYFLTEKGKIQFNEILRNFSLENLIMSENKISLEDSFPDIKFPPFIGILITYKDGSNILKFESYDGALESIIRHNFFNSDETNKDIIPLFLNPFETFFKEMSEGDDFYLKLNGGFLQMFNFEEYTITLFQNSDVDSEAVITLVKDHLKKLFKKHQTEFKDHKTGSLNYDDLLIKIGRDWLEKLNSTYRRLSTNYEFFDKRIARDLFVELDNLAQTINTTNSEIHKNIKDLKIELVKNALEKDLGEIRAIRKKIQLLSLTLQI